jgi:DNA-binding MarR family transcriptional regulator
MHVVIATMDSMADTILKEKFNISFSWFHLMIAILYIQPATQTQIADSVGHSQAAVSRMLTILIAKGYVIVKTDPKHKRKNVVLLSEHGKQIAQAANDVLEDEFSKVLNDANIDTALYTQMTQKIIGSLQRSV